MLALSLRDGNLFRRVVSAYWCAFLLGRNIVSIPIPRGYPLPLGRYRRGGLHGDAGVVAEFFDIFEGAFASIGVVACLCCRNYSRG